MAEAAYAADARRRWERLKSRTQALVDSTGKILGYVEESVIHGYFIAYHEANTLGRYIDDRSAKLAVKSNVINRKHKRRHSR